MARVLFTPLAHNDLQIIWDYLAEEAGEETADGILEFMKEMSEDRGFPRVRPDSL